VSERPSLLIVDDEAAILESLRILFKNEGFEVAVAQGGRAALEALERAMPELILTDVRMPSVNGIDVLTAAKRRDADVPVVLMTAQAELKTAIEGINLGAFHYLQKPFDNDELVSICRRALEHRRLKTENRVLKQEIQRRERTQVVKPIGVSKPFRDVMRMVETVAPTDSTVLIQGESGTGKEVIARHIHALSTRAQASFFSINCGALPEGILESELFGHVKGSFTGAVRDHEGLFAAAAGGSFFLDEIGETTPATQIKLLRVLQEREAIPVGGTQPVPVDVRLIAATNRDLEDDMKQGRFRSDLYYRLNVIALHLPRLRDRQDDIPLLADAFLRRMAAERGEAPKTIGPDALEAIMTYDWPGNVRELENALERASTLTKGETIVAQALPVRVTERRTPSLVADRPAANPTLDVVERAYITWILQREGGNKTRAAEALGIDPSTLYRKLARYDEAP